MMRRIIQALCFHGSARWIRVLRYTPWFVAAPWQGPSHGSDIYPISVLPDGWPAFQIDCTYARGPEQIQAGRKAEFWKSRFLLQPSSIF